MVQASLGVHVHGAALPHPCPGDTATIAAGTTYRVGRRIDRPELHRAKFRAFVKKFLKENLTPLNAEADTSFATWIKNTPYTEARKNELTRKLEKAGIDLNKPCPKDWFKVKSFMKDEVYPTWKHARAINSRTDEFKALVGPIFQLISDKLFATEWFIKKIPIQDRPQYIIDLLHRIGAWYLISDYTSFEAHFIEELQEDCELQLYKYMTKNLPQGKQWYDIIREAKCGTNQIRFKNFTCELKAKRMSGEMDTSTSNGFSNLMFMLYLMSESNCQNVKGVIEGDDGLFVCTGNPPDEKIFRDFGLIIKMGKVSDLNHASFCGMVFDLEERTNVTNPIEELVSFGWTSAKYAKSSKKIHMTLIRAKALSLAYQYPACPILTKFAYKMAQLTASYQNSRQFLDKKGFTNQYEREMMIKAHEYFDKNGLIREPGPKTRLLVQQLYDISIEDQKAIESHIEQLDSIQPLNIPALHKYMDKSWIDYYDHYATYAHTKSRLMDDAAMHWPQKRKPFNHKLFMRS